MFHMLANIARVPILSTYTFMAGHRDGNLAMLELRRIYNRAIYPRHVRQKPPYLCIMWTRADGKRNAQPNHFVPLVP